MSVHVHKAYDSVSGGIKEWGRNDPMIDRVSE